MNNVRRSHLTAQILRSFSQNTTSFRTLLGHEHSISDPQLILVCWGKLGAILTDCSACDLALCVFGCLEYAEVVSLGGACPGEALGEVVNDATDVGPAGVGVVVYGDERVR